MILAAVRRVGGGRSKIHRKYDGAQCRSEISFEIIGSESNFLTVSRLNADGIKARRIDSTQDYCKSKKVGNDHAGLKMSKIRESF
jgi:hypothetical protein